MNTISLDSAVAITGVSRSTLIRRVRDGAITAGEKDASNRTTLALGDVLGLVSVPLSREDLRVLLQADAGDATAQADMGALFYLADADAAAMYWLHKAADQDNAEAMHWLGTVCAEADPPDAERAVMWIARAAALGHPIAQQQIDALLGATLTPGHD